MILIALLLMVVVAVAIMVSKRRTSTRLPKVPSAGSPVITERTAVPAYLEALLERWRTAGVITGDQAERIRSFERTALESASSQAGRRTHVHAIAEALGYLGGMLGGVGLVVLIAEFWNDFSDLTRLLVPTGAMAALVLAGVFVPESHSAAMLRLRTFLWSLATVAAGLAAWVFAEVVLDVGEVRRQWMAVGVVTAIVSVALWAGRNRPVQQFTGAVGSALAIATVVGEFASVGFSGLAVWVAGSLLLALATRETGARALTNVLAGSLGVVVGAYLTIADWRGPGLLFVLVSALVLISPASVRRVNVAQPIQMTTGIVGLLALVQGVPMCLIHFAQQAGLVTGLAVWTIGIVTVILVGRSLLRMDLVFLLVSGVMIIGGAAVTASQFVGFATLFGLGTSISLIAYGARPGRALMSVFGLIGIVVFVPWMIGHFFPGEGRVPLLIIVSGFVLVAAAVVLTRLSGRLRGEVRMRS